MPDETPPQTEAAHFYETWRGRIKHMRKAMPETGGAFGQLHQALMTDGALSVREKELIALGIGMAIHCDKCIYSHVEAGVRAGATRAQLLEVGAVVVAMQGGPGYVELPALVEALDALGVA
jgi:AhpD family alkylhydroperoxidase